MLVSLEVEKSRKKGRKKEPLNFQIALRKSHKSWPDDEKDGERVGEKEEEKGRVKMGEIERVGEKKKLSFWR